MLVEHFASRTIQYMITNITKWDAHSINQLLGTTLSVMCPANGEKYAELHRLVTKSLRLESPNCWRQKSLFAIWQKIAPIRELAKRKYKNRKYAHIKMTI